MRRVGHLIGLLALNTQPTPGRAFIEEKFPLVTYRKDPMYPRESHMTLTLNLFQIYEILMSYVYELDVSRFNIY